MNRKRKERLKIFAERLRLAMDIAGLSPGELFYVLAGQGEKVTRTTIYNWCNGRCLPLMRHLRTLSRVLDTTTAFLLGQETHVELCHAGSQETPEDSSDEV